LQKLLHLKLETLVVWHRLDHVEVSPLAVDYVKGGIDLELEYAVLAGLCAEMLDGNCVGVYVPRERSFIPNDGSLLPELHRITLSRHHGVTQDRSRVN
jgi:hypothetical protein